MLNLGNGWEYSVLAPATIANLGPCFDVLGVAVSNIEDVGSSSLTVLGDVVHIRPASQSRSLLTITKIYTKGEVNTSLTMDPNLNVAGKAALDVLSNNNGKVPLEIILEKMPFFGSGMGSSAASVVAGAYATLMMMKQMDKALIAETVVRCEVGQHPDNVLPALFGGFVGSYGMGNSNRRYQSLVDAEIQSLKVAVEIVGKVGPLDEIIQELAKIESGVIRKVLEIFEGKGEKLRRLNNRMQNYSLLIRDLTERAQRYLSGFQQEYSKIKEVIDYLEGRASSLREGGFEYFPSVIAELKRRGIREIESEVHRAQSREEGNIRRERRNERDAQNGLMRVMQYKLQKTLDGFSSPVEKLDYHRLQISESVYEMVHFVLVKPDTFISTEEARKRINKYPPLGEVVANSQSGIKLVSCLYEGDIRGFGEATCRDKIVEPARAPLISGYYNVKEAALRAGAYGFNISGSGPTCFAVTDDIEKARHLARVMMDEFSKVGMGSSGYICKIDREGARRI